MNDKLEHAAHSYADVVKEIIVADRKAQRARTELENLKEARERIAKELGEFVGSNIRRKAVAIPSGVIVTVEYVSDNCLPYIHVYDNGEELT